LTVPDAASGVATAIAFETIADAGGLAVIAADWRELERRAATGSQFYQTYGWVESWWRRIGARGNYALRIVAGRVDGRLVLVWPLMVERGRLCRTLTSVGGVLTPYADAIVETRGLEPAWLAAAIGEIASWRDYDVVRLDDVRADAAIAPLLEAWLGPPVTADAGVHVDCAAFAGFEAFFASLSKKTRQNQRRSRKFLADRGAITAAVDDGGAAVEETLRQAVAFKQDWLKERGLAHAVLESDVAFGFLADAALAGQADGTTVVSRLFLDGRPVATGLGFLFKGRFNYYLGAFDNDLQEFGPGRLQMEEALRWCFAHGVAVYDMMPPDTAFKAIWTTAKTPTASYMAGRGLVGAFCGSLYPRRLRPMLKRAYNALPRDLHRLAGRIARR
jgi:CelD/BcsL family acetyltransferase involved in cellulose biosynthesis